MARATEDGTRADRELFVHNLGWLLSQTRVGVNRIEYDSDTDVAIIVYNNWFCRLVNIGGDSYTEIINDVMKVVV